VRTPCRLICCGLGASSAQSVIAPQANEASDPVSDVAGFAPDMALMARMNDKPTHRRRISDSPPAGHYGGSNGDPL